MVELTERPKGDYDIFIEYSGRYAIWKAGVVTRYGFFRNAEIESSKKIASVLLPM